MRVSPLRKLQQQAEAALVPYGPAEADVLLVETFGELDLEYAALRKGCILLDQPHRGTLEITGVDRIDFLNRMVTQELKGGGKPGGDPGLQPFHVRRSFWLNRKGRIDADLRLIELGTRMYADLDVHSVERTIKGLQEFIITEDVKITDRSGGPATGSADAMHRMALHGPTAAALLTAVSKPIAGAALSDLTPDRVSIVSVAGHDVIVDRDDSAGEIGLELLMPGDAAVAVYQQLIEAGQEHDGEDSVPPVTGSAAAGASVPPVTGSAVAGAPSPRPFRLRPAGWHAYNIARIEAGRPLYNLDFGPDSLPHESGVLYDRVSFKKGCYLGQEIVARMESRGHSKRSLVGLRCEIPDPAAPPDKRPQPITGAQVWRADTPDGDPIGVVTSSTLSPMLGAVPICFAAIKPPNHEPGTKLLVAADDARISATVQPSLVFWKR